MKNADMPAMPVLEENNIAAGLTKREHFAAMAMQGILSNSETMDFIAGDVDLSVANQSVCMADALLAELEK